MKTTTAEARAVFRASISKRLHKVIEKLFEMAEAGDVQAARTLMERVLPAARPESLPVQLPTVADASSATDQADLLVKAVARGEIAPDVGAELMAGIANAARIADFDKVAAEVRQLREQLERTKR